MLPSPLSKGIDSLEDYVQIDILDRFWKDEKESKYVIQIEIKHDTIDEESRIPTETKWHIVVDANYPSGSITIYPSSDGGIKKTFAHQMQNRRGDPCNPWRTGNICVEQYESIVGRSADKEPHTAEERLLWYGSRTVNWVRDAAKGEVRKSDESYEVPDFNSSSSNPTLVFNETYSSFDEWNAIEDNWGYVKLLEIENSSNQLLVKEFLNDEHEVLYQPDWGDYPCQNAGEEINSAWLFLEEPPFQEPWAAPETWEELESLLSGIPRGIYGLIAEFVNDLSPDEDRYLLVGFPIPKRIGEEVCLVHWKAIQIPQLYSTIFDNHRDIPRTRRRETRSVLRTKSVRWLSSENWANEQLLRRGSVSEALADSKILLIGAGALGSLLADNLVRAGVRNLIVIDKESFEVGNTSRHTLTLNDIGEPKASSVAERLRSISPHVEVKPITSSFPPSNDCTEEINDVDLVIDCTGEDSLLDQLKTYPWYDAVRFCSVSMGRRGDRLFVFRAYNNKFPYSRFNDEIEEWIAKEDLERTEDDIVTERVGCWHPASVISMDKIAAWSGITSNLVEELMNFGQGESDLTVLERDQALISKVEKPFSDSITWTSPDSSRTMQLLQECNDKMKQLCTEARDQETGGILVGKYTDDGKNALVAIADEPAPDSVQTSTTLHRGTDGVNEWLAEQRELKDIRYLGEWHYHPDGRPEPSVRDKTTLTGIVENEDYSCSNPILIIVCQEGQSEFSKGVYVFHENKEMERLEKDS